MAYKLTDNTEEKLGQKFDQKLERTFDQKLKPIYDKMDMLEMRQKITNRKLDDLSLDVKVSERSIRKDIHLLKDAQETVIAVLENRGIFSAVP